MFWSRDYVYFYSYCTFWENVNDGKKKKIIINRYFILNCI